MAQINGTLGNDILNGTPGDDTILGKAGNDTLRGKAGDDTLKGGGGRDKLFGGDGSDQLFGGNGNDLLNPGSNTDVDEVWAGKGKDKIVLSGVTEGFVLLHHDDLVDGITATLDGNANTGTIDKTGAGTTTIKDIQTPMQAGAFGIYGSAFGDVFDITVADGGWMLVNGGDGADSYEIGVSTGSVRLDMKGGSEGVKVNLATGVIANDGFGNVEAITGPGKFWEVRTGDNDDEVIGSANDESFILGAGTDSVDGRDGYDRLRYDRSGVDGVTLDLEAGTATGMWDGAAFNHTISGIERVIGSVGNDVMTGSAGDDRLEGRDGDDVIQGGGGNDLLQGDDGNDTLSGGDGDDRLEGGNGNDTLNGGDGRDKLRGGDGDDILNPGDNTSGDSINAGRGNDQIILSDISTGSVSIDHWDLGAGISATIDGNANTGTIDKLDGGDTSTITDIKNPMLANGLVLSGSLFDDVLNATVADGGWMALHGRAGQDSYNIGASTGYVRLDFIDYDGGTTGVEINLATGVIADDGFGNVEAFTGRVNEVRGTMQGDVIIGSDFNDSFILMAGNDNVDGGVGFDRLRYDRSGVDGVAVDLDVGMASGMWSGAAFIHTISNIERVVGSVGDDSLTGSAGAETLEGRDGDDVIRGGGGKDTLLGGNDKDKLFGGKGKDLLQGESGNDTLKGDAGRDRLEGGDGKDVLFGGGGNDRMLGGKGNDRMDGGAGNDKMTGNGGNDIFVFGTGQDVVTDFNAANNKEDIDLSGVSAITGFNNLKATFLNEVGGNAVIDDGAGNTLTLNGVAIADLDKGDFIFA